MSHSKNLLAGIGVLALSLFAAHAFVPPYIERQRNQTLIADPPPVPVASRLRHRGLLIADLHADSLLWDRDLDRSSDRGHLDLPRMRAGNIALQIFSIVTRVPRGFNMEANAPGLDNITGLSIVQGLPPATWFDLGARVLYHSARLQALADEPRNRLSLIRTRADLARFLDRRRSDPQRLAALLAIEGAHAFEGDLENVERFFGAGIRLVGLVHLFDNRVGGSAHGLHKGGLTAFGRRLIARLERNHMLVDLAHASPQLFRDAVAASTRPLIVSHTGVKGTCPGTRNLSDTQLRALARSGGIVGIGFWPEAVCGKDSAAVVRAIRHAVRVMGVRHVALGSDYDGAVTLPWDAAHMEQLTHGLIAAGFAQEEIDLIMGGNVLRLLARTLPAPATGHP